MPVFNGNQLNFMGPINNFTGGQSNYYGTQHIYDGSVPPPPQHGRSGTRASSNSGPDPNSNSAPSPARSPRHSLNASAPQEGPFSAIASPTEASPNVDSSSSPGQAMPAPLVHETPPCSSERVDTAMGASELVLRVLSVASSGSPIETLKVVSSLALTILDNVQKARDNKKAFERLGHDACQLVAYIVKAYDERKPQGTELDKNLRSLHSTLMQIGILTKERAARGLFMSIMLSRLDERKAYEYREQLWHSMSLFGVFSIAAGHSTET